MKNTTTDQNPVEDCNEEGFLNNPNTWDEHIAQKLAEHEVNTEQLKRL